MTHIITFIPIARYHARLLDIIEKKLFNVFEFSKEVGISYNTAKRIVFAPETFCATKTARKLIAFIEKYEKELVIKHPKESCE